MPLIPIIDFRRGIRTQPSFQRGSQNAPLDLLNIMVEGQGRPVQRLGYTPVENVETSGEVNGNQLIRVHDLGNSQRSAISRFYRLVSNESYIDTKGRLFVSDPDENRNEWHDIQNDISYRWDFTELEHAPLIERISPATLETLFNENHGIQPGGLLIPNYFSFAYTLESRRFGIETVLSRARVRDFPTYSGGTYDENIRFTATFPSEALPLPEWVDRINFYMQTTGEFPVHPERRDGDTFDPNGTDRQYVRFGHIDINDALRVDNGAIIARRPVTLQNPNFVWTEGDLDATYFEPPLRYQDVFYVDESDLFPNGRGDYRRAEPTLVSFEDEELKEIDAINDLTVSPINLHPIMLYAERIWGWDKEEQLLRFSELGEYDKFPADYALELSKSGQSRVSAMHPAPTVSAFFVFKQDAIHVIRGSGNIDGLRTQTLASTDLDASGVILQHGMLSPRTIVSGENGIYFISRDKKLKYLTVDGFGNTNVNDIGVAIDDFLEVLTLAEQKKLIAFLYENCYHIIMPDYVLAVDIQKRYWTRISWDLKDAFWSEGGINEESILYGLTADDTIVTLYEGETDGGNAIACEFESQDFQLPYETNVTGVAVYHTSGEGVMLSVDLYMDDVFRGTFTSLVEKANHFEIPVFGYGHRVRVRIRSENGIPLINAVLLNIPD